MQQPVIVALLNNAALLLVLSVIYEITYLLYPKTRIKQVVNGLLVALICLAIMAMSFKLRPGVVFDTRSILISVTALIFGPVATLITAVTAIAYRIFLGGAGVLSGIAVILSSAVIGSVWRRWFYSKTTELRWLSVYAMGVCVHVTMLGCIYFLPNPDSASIVREIMFPVLLIYPIATVLLCLLLIQQQIFGQLRDQLKQSEERFRLMFDKAPLSYQSLDRDGNIIDVNQQWLDTFEHSRDEVIGHRFSDFLHPAYQEEFVTKFALFKKLGNLHSEFEILRHNGESLYIAIDGNIGLDLEGDFTQAHCILRDITEQKKAENGLRTSETKYRRLYETMAQGVVYQAADGKILSANPAAERILGLTLDQLMSRSSQDPGWKTIHEDGSELPGSEHPAMIALRTGKPYGPVVLGVFQPQLNDHVWISVNAIPIYDNDDTPTVYTTFKDVTAERKAVQDYQLLFNAMVDGFALHEIICDHLGNPKDYRFLAVNPAFEQMTGMHASDIIGKTVLEVFPETESYWIETYGKVALTGRSVMFENYAAANEKHFRVMAYRPAPMQFACTFSDDTLRIQAEQNLFNTLARLRSLLDNSHSPIFVFDDKGYIIEISVIAEKIIGLSRDKISNMNMKQLGMSDVFEKALQLTKKSPEAKRITESIDLFEINGEKRYFESRLFLIDTNQADEKLFGYLGIDVTDRIAAEQALKESEKKYSSYIESSPYAVVVVDEKGNFLEANSAALAITGYSREQILKMDVWSITAPDSMDEAVEGFKSLLKDGRMSAELKYIHRNGFTGWWTVDVVKLSQNRFLGFSIDITGRKQAEAALINLSERDYLTGVYNRRFFETELERLNAENQLPISVMFGDINGVKLINDAFGHAVGDKLIKESAAILMDCCREGDVMARIGGDEFGILMPNTDRAAASEVVSNIQAALKEFDANSNSEMYQHSVSLGYATKYAIDEDIKEIIKNAEGYMYQRKLLEHTSLHSTIVSSIKATLFEKSHETEEHAERLVSLSKAVGAVLDLPQTEMDKLELLATLHDIGKVAIRDDILTKQGELNDTEWAEMRRHPEIGYRIAMTSPELVPIAEGILCHQEWWDGRGYPQGLSGENIPLLSRIVAVVDAYDAMTNDRPYRKALTHEVAVERILENAGTQFDPEIAQIFTGIVALTDTAL